MNTKTKSRTKNIQSISQTLTNDPSQELATEKIGKLIKKFAIPCVISLLVSALYNIVDQIFIGQAVGFNGNAATNVVLPITVVACAFAFMIGDGAAAYLSLKNGSGELEKGKKGIGNAITLLCLVSIVFFVVGIVFQEKLLSLFGATDKILDLAMQYMKYIVYGLPFYIISSGLNSVIRADGSPKYAMFSMLIGAIANLILDPLLMFVVIEDPALKISGAAIATAISQFLSFLVTLFYLKRFKTIKLDFNAFKLKFQTVKSVCSLGVSSFITQMAITIVIVTVNNSLTYYGGLSKYGSEIPLAAHGIVMKVNQILTSIVVGIAVGAQPILGFNYGAKNYKRVKETFAKAIKISLTVGACALIIFEFFPQMIINIFGQEEGLYNEFALLCFRIFLAMCIGTAFQITSGIFFQAIGKPVKSAILSLSRQILYFVPVVLLLPKLFSPENGVLGILFAGPVSDTLAFITSIIFIALEMKNLNQKIHLPATPSEKNNTIPIPQGKTICIGREFGTGGHEIGELLAKKLNYSFYDKELIMMAAKNSGIDAELFEKVDEKSIDSFWYTLSMSAYSYSDSVNTLTPAPTNELLFQIQSDTIRQLATQGNTIFVGRCSNAILKDTAIRIFIYSNMANRVNRIKEKYHLSNKKAETLIKQADKKRRAYYSHYTDGIWGNKEEYDFMLNVSNLTMEEAVEKIIHFVEEHDKAVIS